MARRNSMAASILTKHMLTKETNLMVHAAFCLLDRNGDGVLGKEDFQGNLAPVGVGEDTFKDADRVWQDLADECGTVDGQPAQSIKFEQFIAGIVRKATSTMTFSPELAGRPDEGDSTILRWLQCLETAANYHVEYLLMRVLCIATVLDARCLKVFDDLWALLCTRAGHDNANRDRIGAMPRDEFWLKFWEHFNRCTERMSTEAGKKQRTEDAHTKGLSKMELMDRFKRLAYMGPKDLQRYRVKTESVHAVFMSMMEKDKSSVTHEKFNVEMNKQLLLWLTEALRCAQ